MRAILGIDREQPNYLEQSVFYLENTIPRIGMFIVTFILDGVTFCGQFLLGCHFRHRSGVRIPASGRAGEWLSVNPSQNAP
jgi:hypothetical protein